MVKLFGILNVTPDSFSDGGASLDPSSALSHAEQLIAEGADVIDVGGDSTRPGSYCVGPEEEWRRIGIVVTVLASTFPVSVDTHHASVARKALDLGVTFINDVSGGRDPEMLQVVADSDASIILMHSTGEAPHTFGEVSPEGVVQRINTFFSERIEAALAAGIPKKRIVLDPGMGAFLSPNPTVSWTVLKHFDRIGPPDFSKMLGVSRKGFLAQGGGDSVAGRDAISALIPALIASRTTAAPLLIRAHTVSLLARFLQIEALLRATSS